MYPLENIPLPSNPHAPVDMPEMAHGSGVELRGFEDIRNCCKGWHGGINDTIPRDVTRDLRRAYYASISYVDSLIGELLGTVDDLGLRKNTIVAFWSDHGYHLGENGIWSKGTNFEVATHTPLMVSAPGRTDKGVTTDALVEFVDLFPSLADLAVPAVPLCPLDSSNVKVCSEGLSFVPLIEHPRKEWKKGAFSQYPRMDIQGNFIMGYSVRTKDQRCTKWIEFDINTWTPTDSVMDAD
jgi:iduronate 2-sulfatase